MIIERAPLEDELGDVLDKALRHGGLSEAVVSEQAGIALGRLQDAIDYRYDLEPGELRRLAAALGLNEAGLLAVAGGRYPLPEIQGLPFCVYPLRMTHGIGVTNAYLIADCRSESGLLFDTGVNGEALYRVWPSNIRKLDAVFITHLETEHSGGLEAVRRDFAPVPIFTPSGSVIEGASSVGEGARLIYDDLEVEVFSTPGHAEAHNCYVIRSRTAAVGTALLISGDLLFAGSVGGAYFCVKRLCAHLRRLMGNLPEDTVVAPGHGPLTTIKNERMLNPFVV